DHRVTAYDADAAAVQAIATGRLPVSEPGLDDLVRQGLDRESLRFTADARLALRDADVLWIAWDTPVNEDDQADGEAVVHQVAALLSHLQPGALVVMSSQLPVGTTARLERLCADARPGSGIDFVS